MFPLPDVTAIVKRVLNAPEVPNSGSYPGAPTPKQAVFDVALQRVVMWDGSQWVQMVTRFQPRT